LSIHDTNRHIKTRDQIERKKLIQQAKKKGIANATADAILAARNAERGDLKAAEDSAETEDSVNSKIIIDTIGEGC
jgi:2-methylcitrate dehydratase PrpD